MSGLSYSNTMCDHMKVIQMDIYFIFNYYFLYLTLSRPGGGGGGGGGGEICNFQTVKAKTIKFDYFS